MCLTQSVVILGLDNTLPMHLLITSKNRTLYTTYSKESDVESGSSLVQVQTLPFQKMWPSRRTDSLFPGY